MVTDKFGTVLEELGKIYQTKLTPNQRGGCLIRYKNGLSIQLESDGDYVMLACEIAQMSQGRYRENIFREALKANGLAPSATNPRSGVFAYGKKNESLVLNDRFLLDELTGAKLADYLQLMLQKAEVWKSAIAKGEIPSYLGTELSFGRAQGSGMFGLQR
jgi:hypothetical protein